MAVALVADKTEVTTLSPARAALAEHLAALAKLRSEVERNQKPVDRLREQGRVAGEPCQICALTLGFARLRERATERAAVAQLVRAPDCGSGGRWFESPQLYQLCRTIFGRSYYGRRCALSTFQATTPSKS